MVLMKTFKVISEYVGEEGHELKAFDHEAAAEEYAEWEDQMGDYSFANGKSEVITVEGPNGDRKKFRVSAEQSVTYMADEIT